MRYILAALILLATTTIVDAARDNLCPNFDKIWSFIGSGPQIIRMIRLTENVGVIQTTPFGVMQMTPLGVIRSVFVGYRVRFDPNKCEIEYIRINKDQLNKLLKKYGVPTSLRQPQSNEDHPKSDNPFRL